MPVPHRVRRSVEPTGRSRLGLSSTPALRALGEAQDGVVTRAQLAAVGVDRAVVREEVSSRRWQLLGPRIVLLSPAEPTRRRLLRAAGLAAEGRAWVAGRSALELHGFEDVEPGRIHLQAPAGRRVTAFVGVVTHATYRWVPDDEREVDGILTTTPARAAVDAARWERSPRMAAGVVLAAIQQRLCSIEEIEAVMARFEKFQQSVAVRQAIVDAAEGADSLGEVDTSDLVVRAGLPQPIRQYVLQTALGARRYDLGVQLPDGAMLLIEVDGPTHRSAEARRRDAIKDAAAEAAGHRLLRVDPVQVRRNPWPFLALLRDIRDDHAAP